MNEKRYKKYQETIYMYRFLLHFNKTDLSIFHLFIIFKILTFASLLRCLIK